MDLKDLKGHYLDSKNHRDKGLMAWPAYGTPCRPAARLALRAQPLRKQRPWSCLPSSPPLLGVLALSSAGLALRGSYRMSALLLSRLLLLLYAVIFGSLAPQIKGLLCLEAGGRRAPSCTGCGLWALAAMLAPPSARGGLVAAVSLALLSRIYRGLMSIAFLKFQRLGSGRIDVYRPIERPFT